MEDKEVEFFIECWNQLNTAIQDINDYWCGKTTVFSEDDDVKIARCLNLTVWRIKLEMIFADEEKTYELTKEDWFKVSQILVSIQGTIDMMRETMVDDYPEIAKIQLLVVEMLTIIDTYRYS